VAVATGLWPVNDPGRDDVFRLDGPQGVATALFVRLLAGESPDVTTNFGAAKLTKFFVTSDEIK